jgi:hypothetical protein
VAQHRTIGVASFVTEAALQVSGIQSKLAAAVLISVAVVSLLYAAYHFVKDRLVERSPEAIKRWDRRKRKMIYALPIIGVLVGGFIFVGSIAWILADGRKANSEVAKTLSRYVLPRHLTEVQISQIAGYLKGFGLRDAKFLVLKNSGEASSYAADFQLALTNGGWTFSVEYADNVPEGISTDLRSAPAQKQQTPSSDQIFIDALLKAHVRMEGNSSGGGGSVLVTTFTIQIGRRRMDDGDLKVRELQRERARKTLEDED